MLKCVCYHSEAANSTVSHANIINIVDCVLEIRKCEQTYRRIIFRRIFPIAQSFLYIGIKRCCSVNHLQLHKDTDHRCLRVTYVQCH